MNINPIKIDHSRKLLLHLLFDDWRLPVRRDNNLLLIILPFTIIMMHHFDWLTLTYLTLDIWHLALQLNQHNNFIVKFSPSSNNDNDSPVVVVPLFATWFIFPSFRPSFLPSFRIQRHTSTSTSTTLFINRTQPLAYCFSKRYLLTVDEVFCSIYTVYSTRKWLFVLLLFV